MTTRVVNRHHHVHYDQYIGRGTIYGNPFELPPKPTAEDRERCLEQFAGYFLDRVQKDLVFRHEILKLRGKILGCSCVPKKCHGVFMAEWIDAQPSDAPLDVSILEETPKGWPPLPDDPQAALEALRAEMAGCSRCGLSKGRTNIVFGVGPATSKVMLVGEGPGQTEDETGEPFVGNAGKLLNRLLKDAGMSRDAVFIGNVVKCRPPGNRDPEPTEMRACEPWLRRQIEILQPKVFVALGRFAASRLSGQFGTMGALLDQDLKYEGRVPVIAVYHPSYILRLLNGPKDKAKMTYESTVERFRTARTLADAS